MSRLSCSDSSQESKTWVRHRWAWGAARVVDFLLSDAALAPLVDPKKIMTMGHSRGGKTALWHGALDERVSITFPLMSGCVSRHDIAGICTT